MEVAVTVIQAAGIGVIARSFARSFIGMRSTTLAGGGM
jgi:hypothetical protein